jgi:hypothetical protein
VLDITKLYERYDAAQDELNSVAGTPNNRSTELGRKLYNRKSALYRKRKRLAAAINRFVAKLEQDLSDEKVYII